MHPVFVYGTLKSGQSRNHILTNAGAVHSHATLVEPEAVVQGYTLFDAYGSFPAMMPGRWHEHVEGEVWEVDDYLLGVLDGIEGVPHLYQRVRVRLRNGQEAWSYVWAMEPLLDHIGSKWEGR